MESIELIRDNLRRSEEIALAGVEEMREHALVFPTPRGGCHTLWVLGHLAYIEGLVVQRFMLGRANPLAAWEAPFDGADVSDDGARFPPFDEVLAECRAMRRRTLTLAESLSEDEIDASSADAPEEVEALFGTYRRCLQYAADHFYMHRGHLADARRAAGLTRAWY